MRYTCSNLSNERESATNTPAPSNDQEGMSFMDAFIYSIPFSPLHSRPSGGAA